MGSLKKQEDIMIEVGDRITYNDGCVILITDSNQCALANMEHESGQVKSIERVKWIGLY